jgi:phosphoribosylformylglycinamidine synthase
LKTGAFLEMPVEHAEGKVITASDAVADELEHHDLIATRYVDSQGRTDRYPENPNGSSAGIAGLCDSTGRVFGLMPHPDRAFDHTHHPTWTRAPREGIPDGLSIFTNAVRHWSA